MIQSDKCIVKVTNDGLELSNSKLGTFRSCPFRYNLKYIQGLRPIAESKSLYFGSWIHEVLEAYDRGDSVKDKIVELEKKWSKLFIEERDDLGDIPGDTRKILKKYFKTYSADDKANHTVVWVEQDFIIEIPGTPIHLTGKIDKLTKDKQGRYWIWEHKTAKTIPTDEAQRMIEPQTAIYHWVVEYAIKNGILPAGDLAGVIFDYIRSSPPSEPFELARGGLSVAKTKLGCDYDSYLAKIKELGLRMTDYRETLNELKAKEERFLKRVAVDKSAATIKSVMRDLGFDGYRMWHLKNDAKAYYPKYLSYRCTASPRCDYLDACLLDIQGCDYNDLVGVTYKRKEKKNAENEE